MSGATWTERSDGGLVLDGDGFYVSFTPDGHEALGERVFALLGFGSRTAAETALVKDNSFYILNGDWRSDYEGRMPLGFQECLSFFNSMPQHKSRWSE